MRAMNENDPYGGFHLTRSERKRLAETGRASSQPQRFTEASKDGACPKCGGREFRASLSSPRGKIRCKTCGTAYFRS